MSVLILIDAFINLRNTNILTSQILLDITQTTEKQNLLEDGKINPQAKAYLEQLKFQTKGTLDSNTISFLFQIFAIAIVSAGIYLYSRSHENLKSVEDFLKDIKKQAEAVESNINIVQEEVKSINKEVKVAEDQVLKIVRRIEVLEPIFRNNITSSTIVNFFSQAYILSWLIANEESNIGLLVNTREILQQIRSQLLLARKLNLGFDRFTYNSLLDQAINIGQNLKRVGNIENVEDLLNFISDITDILKTTQFIERYDEQLSVLSEEF